MANAFVDTGAKAFADGSVNWGSDTIKAQLLSASFAPTYDSAGNVNNAQWLSDLTAALVGSPVTLAGKSDTAGVLVASDLLFPAITGSVVVRVAVYKSTGVAGTSQLLLMYDTGGGFPITPNGGPINLYWDTGAFKIAQL